MTVYRSNTGVLNRLAAPAAPPVADAGSATAAPRSPDAALALFRLAQGLHEVGIPSSRLEATIDAASERLGLGLELLSNPTALFCTFEHEGRQEVRMARTAPGEVDLGRLVELEPLLADFERGKIGPAAACARLDALRALPPRYSPAVQAAAFAAASASAAAFFRGSALDVAAAAGLGLVTGVLALLAARRARLGAIFEPLASLIVAFATVALIRVGAPLDEGAVLLAGLIVLVPGYTLTVAMTELATRHLTSGTTRLAGALGTLLGMGFGVGLGRALGAFVPASGGAAETLATLPTLDGALPFALIVAPLAFLVLFRARLRDAARILAAGALAFAGARFGAALFGPEIGVCLGALALGAASNLDAKLTRKPASVMLVPGIMMLVPGGIGFQSVASFLAHDTLSGVEAGFRMVLVAMALVAGLLAANAVVRPRGAL